MGRLQQSRVGFKPTRLVNKPVAPVGNFSRSGLNNRGKAPLERFVVPKMAGSFREGLSPKHRAAFDEIVSGLKRNPNIALSDLYTTIAGRLTKTTGNYYGATEVERIIKAAGKFGAIAVKK